MRLSLDSWRWEGVPWYLRSGKYLAETAAEFMVELKPPPQRHFADSAPTTGRANYLRFKLSPGAAIAMAARVKVAGKDFVGDQRELYLSEEQPGEEPPYERLLGDAMAGDGALFAREDTVEAAWAVVAPVLKAHHRFVCISAAVGGQKRRTGSSRRTAVGITQIHPNKIDATIPRPQAASAGPPLPTRGSPVPSAPLDLCGSDDSANFIS
jgi:glucose-6-phosphate 1-dehydrogenase